MDPNAFSAWNLGDQGNAPYPGGAPGGYPGYPGQQGFPNHPYPNQPGGFPAAAPEYHQGGAGFQQPFGGYQQPAGGYQPPAGGYQPPAGGYQQPAGGYQPPAGGYQPPAGGYQQPAGGYQPPAGGYQQPPAGAYQQPGGGYQAGIPGSYPGGYGGAAGGAVGASPMADIYEPTVRSPGNFKAQDDCDRIRKATKGMGTDEKALIDIFGHRTISERVQIAKTYKSAYGKDLIELLKKETTGHFEDVLVALCQSHEEFDARELRRAMEGAGTEESILIEILASRTNEQLQKIKDVYPKLFPGRNLEKDIASETHGDFEHLLIALLQGRNEQNQGVDMALAARDAQELYSAGEKRAGTDEAKFISILGSRSPCHLRQVFSEYQKISKRDIESALKSEMHGDMLQAFLAVVRCVTNKSRYFALRLKKAMEGAGTKDRSLIRIIVSRCDIDLGRIKTEFQKEFGKTLQSCVEKETSGDYRRLLLALLG